MRVLSGRLLWLLLTLVSFPVAFAQTPTQYAIAGNLSGISSSTGDLLQARFSLVNCGDAFPTIGGATIAVDKIKIETADTSGNFTDVLWGNDQISCNLGFTTAYQVQLLRNNVPVGQPKTYRITNPGLGVTWNLTSALPAATLPPANVPASGYQCPAGKVLTGIAASWFPICQPLTGYTASAIVGSATANQTILQAPGTTLAVSSLNNQINVDTFAPGQDIGAKIAAADLQMGAAAGILTVNTPGTISTAVTLRAGHSLLLNASVTSAATVTLAGSQTVRCAGGVSITSAGGHIFEGAGGADGISIAECGFTTGVGDGSWLMYVGTYNTHLSMIHNVGTGNLFFQSNGGGGAGSHYLFENNTASYSTGDASIFITQNWDDIQILGNHFDHGISGVEFFGTDAGTNPSYATITGSTNKNVLIADNTCEIEGATCAWGSGMWRTSMIGNIADGCGDICFDFEGTADSLMAGNTAKNFTNGAFCPGFFTAFHNSVIGNTAELATDGAIIILKNASNFANNIFDIQITGNHLKCLGPICAAFHLETTTALLIGKNDILDGRIDNVGAEQMGRLVGNDWTFTQAVGASLYGLHAGIDIPRVYQNQFFATDNTVTTLVPQTGPCLQLTDIDGSAPNLYDIDGNKCYGAWSAGINLTAATSSTFNLHNNVVPTLTFTVSGPAVVNKFNNRVLSSGAHD